MTSLGNGEQERSLEARLSQALQARSEWLVEPHTEAFRLFNGFTEGDPDVGIDVYARTLVLFNYAKSPQDAQPRIAWAQNWLVERLPWIQAVVVKTRHANNHADRCGALTFGQSPDRKVREHGIWYAVDLMLNLDASLYLDTRGLRAWVTGHLAGKSVLNTFAYTGSFGVAALAGGAKRVLQVDRNRRFLDQARASCLLNGFSTLSSDFICGDFWMVVNQLKRQGSLFDCVIVDPPFFSVTSAGKVDLVRQSWRVINKVRPLVADGGSLVTINNALFVSGEAYMNMLSGLCESGYLSIDELIPIPSDITGYHTVQPGVFPADPSPFNHPTKIAVLKVRRKDGKNA